MPVEIVEAANGGCRLEEGQVGKAARCEYPGIAQCFAIAGRRQSFLAGAHVSPGFSAQDVTDTFERLKDVGGSWAHSWYVIGPFHDFFNHGAAPWRSTRDIRDAFALAFGDTGADHWIMNVSAIRNWKTLDPTDFRRL